MNKPLPTAFVLLLFLQPALALGEAPEDTPLHYVSLVDLLVRPELSSPHVTATGYLGEGPVYRLFLSSDHAALHDAASSIGVGFQFSEPDLNFSGIPSTGCEKSFVRVYGYLEQINSEWLLQDVYRVERESEGWQPAVCWEASQK